jgi:hypothetical protein
MVKAPTVKLSDGSSSRVRPARGTAYELRNPTGIKRQRLRRQSPGAVRRLKDLQTVEVIATCRPP